MLNMNYSLKKTKSKFENKLYFPTILLLFFEYKQLYSTNKINILQHKIGFLLKASWWQLHPLNPI